MRPEPAPLLYESAAKVQPRRAHGRFQNLRNATMCALLGAYYGIPWLSWNGHPLVWFDLPHRRFHLPGLTLAPQDLFLLAALLFIAALTLFLFTALAGRLWCGYACPQTVWTSAFLWIEQVCEGDRHARLRLDRAAWTREKLLRRGAKHLLWMALAGLTGLTFVAYFVPARDLFPAALQGELGGWPLFWSLFYGVATWGNAGFMREQVCKYMCPYARFQSAMFDRDTLIIAYDDKRGEPRKTLAKKLSLAAGDCTDCSLCVQVCPMGIDIRKGLQYECIACAACVDACDSVMDAVQRPRGLVRYTTARRDAGQSMRWLRPRVIGYGLVWLVACAGFVVLLFSHAPVRLDVLRDRHTLVRERADGALENLYVFKLSSGDDQARAFDVQARLDSGVKLSVTPARMSVPAGVTNATPVTLQLDRSTVNAGLPAVVTVDIRLIATDGSGLELKREARFISRLSN